MLTKRDFFGAVVLVMLLAIAAMPTLSRAQSSVVIPVATGSPTGSYFKFASQAANVCSDVAKLSIMPSAGSTANLDMIEGNETALAITQLDILDLYRRTKDMSNVKLLVPLFPEQVHFITRGDVMKTEGGVQALGKYNVFGSKVHLNDVSDLAGKRVAAAGGSYKTAQVIAIITGIPMTIYEVATADAAMQHVMDGSADAAVLVGAQPVGTITGSKEKPNPLLPNLRLLPVPDALVTKLSSVYTKAQPLRYAGMGVGGDNVQTVQVASVMVTQNYPKSAMGDAVYAFQKCMLERAGDQATIPGNHPAWRNIKTTAGVNWEAWNYAGTRSSNVQAAGARAGQPGQGKK